MQIFKRSAWQIIDAFSLINPQNCKVSQEINEVVVGFFHWFYLLLFSCCWISKIAEPVFIESSRFIFLLFLLFLFRFFVFQTEIVEKTFLSKNVLKVRVLTFLWVFVDVDLDFLPLFEREINFITELLI